jgi:hypothetical protein
VFEAWGRILSPSSYPSTALVDLIRFFSFLIYTKSVGLLGRGITPSQGRYLRTEQHKYRINTHRHPCLEWIRAHDPSVRAGEDDSCLRRRGHSERRSIYLEQGKMNVWYVYIEGWIGPRSESWDMSIICGIYFEANICAQWKYDIVGMVFRFNGILCPKCLEGASSSDTNARVDRSVVIRNLLILLSA